MSKKSLLTLPPELRLRILTHLFTATIPPSRLIKPRYLDAAHNLRKYRLYRITCRPDSQPPKLPRNWDAISYTCIVLGKESQDVLRALRILEVYLNPDVSDEVWTAARYVHYGFLARTKGYKFDPCVGPVKECGRVFRSVGLVRVFAKVVNEGEMNALARRLGDLVHGIEGLKVRLEVVVAFGEDWITGVSRETGGSRTRSMVRRRRVVLGDGPWESMVQGLEKLKVTIAGKVEIVIVLGKLWEQAEGKERFKEAAIRVGGRVRMLESDDVNETWINQGTQIVDTINVRHDLHP